MSACEPRRFTAILDDIYCLTNRMAEQRHDPDFLIQSVNRRQALMDEYDVRAQQYPQEKTAFEQNPAARDQVAKIRAMDLMVMKALKAHKAAAHKDVAGANAQQKVLDYLHKVHPSEGSLMDYRK